MAWQHMQVSVTYGILEIIISPITRMFLKGNKTVLCPSDQMQQCKKKDPAPSLSPLDFQAHLN